MATDKELNDFLASVEKRAFKRCLFQVRDDEAALDIVQDSMMKLAEHYGNKPVAELPMLFQRILSNSTLDWFRRKKTRSQFFVNFSDLAPLGDDSDMEPLDAISSDEISNWAPSGEQWLQSREMVAAIEEEIQKLPARQREAFLLRYWEELDVAETAAAMGCTEGSVKTHCSRAILALVKALKAKGISS
ncbi:MAG: RNA polymerase sigma factor [Alphaproteobacteria bacterium]|nr:RNA polymerase sigma factor [Alphaproteobacteria bacterium]